MAAVPEWYTKSIRVHGWPEETAAAEFPWSPQELLDRFVSVRLGEDEFPERSGYDVAAPTSNDTVRRHHAADDLRDAYALPLGVHSGLEYTASAGAVATGRAGLQRYSVLRFEKLVGAARIRRVAKAYRKMWAAGVRTSKPEDARGSDPAIHCGFWIVYHQVGSPPRLTGEGDPAGFRREQWHAYRAWLVEASVLGWLFLRAIEVVDPPLAAHHKRYMSAFRAWYAENFGAPIPAHWDFGVAPAIATKAGAAYGIHCDHHDGPYAHSAVYNLALGDGGFSELGMSVPQLRCVAPFEDGDCVSFPPRTHRHTNVGGYNSENRVALTFFSSRRFVAWGLAEYERRLAGPLAGQMPPPAPAAPVAAAAVAAAAAAAAAADAAPVPGSSRQTRGQKRAAEQAAAEERPAAGPSRRRRN